MYEGLFSPALAHGTDGRELETRSKIPTNLREEKGNGSSSASVNVELDEILVYTDMQKSQATRDTPNQNKCSA
jgi:hypothetical protein